MSWLGFSSSFPTKTHAGPFSRRSAGRTVHLPKCDSVADAVPWRPRPHRWHCRFCGARFHAGQGTVIEGSHSPLRTWFRAIHLLDERPKLSSTKLGRQLELRQKTAWDLARRLRAMAKEDGPLLRAMAGAGAALDPRRSSA